MNGKRREGTLENLIIRTVFEDGSHAEWERLGEMAGIRDLDNFLEKAEALAETEALAAIEALAATEALPATLGTRDDSLRLQRVVRMALLIKRIRNDAKGGIDKLALHRAVFAGILYSSLQIERRDDEESAKRRGSRFTRGEYFAAVQEMKAAEEKGEKRFSVAGLAEKLGVSPQALRKWKKNNLKTEP